MAFDQDVELAVVGAGPQALTLLTYLAEFRPGTLNRTVVFDPDPFLAQWNRQFAAYRIPVLRSACVHHPHPEPYGLIQFARSRGRQAEMHDPIGRPSTRLFADYCQHLTDSLGLEGLVVRRRITALRPLPGGGAVLSSGTQRWRSARVVLATNPARSVIPSWLGEARSRHRGQPGLLHSLEWSADRDVGSDAEVVVIGGGLTAAQIVAAHAAAGTHVNWVTRQPLRVRHLDVEPIWLGPSLKSFHATADPRARVAMARKARGGGSIPAAERHRLQELIDQGGVSYIQADVDGVHSAGGDGWRVGLRTRGRSAQLRGSSVICATGNRSHVRHEVLLRGCRGDYPTRRPSGMPVLTRGLAWPGTTVHVMGPLALTGVGPAARTLIGARIASERIVDAMGDCCVPRQYPWPA